MRGTGRASAPSPTEIARAAKDAHLRASVRRMLHDIDCEPFTGGGWHRHHADPAFYQFARCAHGLAAESCAGTTAWRGFEIVR